MPRIMTVPSSKPQGLYGSQNLNNIKHLQNILALLENGVGFCYIERVRKRGRENAPLH